MHRSESESLGTCIVCGCSVAPGVDRGFDVASSVVLCWDCAVRRGGRYDPDRERWETPPQVDDLRESD